MKLLAITMLISICTTAFAVDIPENHPPIDQNATLDHSNQAMPDIGSMQQAEVVSVLDTSGYTYIEIKQGKETAWLAVPATAVKAGDTVHFPDGPAVQNHLSRTLNKTFPSVIFLSSVVVNNGNKPE